MPRSLELHWHSEASNDSSRLIDDTLQPEPETDHHQLLTVHYLSASGQVGQKQCPPRHLRWCNLMLISQPLLCNCNDTTVQCKPPATGLYNCLHTSLKRDSQSDVYFCQPQVHYWRQSSFSPTITCHLHGIDLDGVDSDTVPITESI